VCTGVGEGLGFSARGRSGGQGNSRARGGLRPEEEDDEWAPFFSGRRGVRGTDLEDSRVGRGCNLRMGRIGARGPLSFFFSFLFFFLFYFLYLQKGTKSIQTNS
jgi:hypothetical protein